MSSTFAIEKLTIADDVANKLETAVADFKKGFAA